MNKSLLILMLLFLLACSSERGTSDGVQEDQSQRFELICLDDYQYYYRISNHQAMLAPKLDPIGHPVPCK